MALDFSFMVGGEAGQGVQSVSFVLSKVMVKGGYNVFSDQDYESRIRGGHSFSRVRVADRDVRSFSETVNVLLALNRDTVTLHLGEMKPRDGSAIIFDRAATKADVPEGSGFLDIPLEKIALDTTGNKLTGNTVATGAALGLVEYDFDILAETLREQFAHLGNEIAEGNVKAARAGYDYATQHCPPGFTQRISPIGRAKKMLITGNEAVALGAMAAGCKFVAGYPMTPTTGVLEYMADKGRSYNIKVVQAEDEISAINMAVGAGYAGARALTATSGGGFCLMVEGLSLAGMTETPVVVILGMRPGPAIGLPTRTEQGELAFALHAGHGEFPRAILAPACAEDAFWLTVKAFNLAEKYQVPVIVLTDHDLADSLSTIDKFDLKKVQIDRGTLLSNEEAATMSEYKRYQYTESGVSPRAFPMPGNAALVVADSDEHNEEGHIIEDAETRRLMMIKRMHKQELLKADIGKPRFIEKQGAKTTLVGWGSTYGAIMEAQARLSEDGLLVNVLHLSEIWPFPAEDVTAALKSSRSVVVENNATGQMARLIRTETGIKPTATILKFDGRSFSSQHIINELKKEAWL